jgi:hypothetical protein
MRSFPLKGRYYANLFLHFVPKQDDEGGLPNYILPGSENAKIYLKEKDFQFSGKHDKDPVEPKSLPDATCLERLESSFRENNVLLSDFDDLDIVIHRNGEADSCGRTTVNFMSLVQQTLLNTIGLGSEKCTLTNLFHNNVTDFLVSLALDKGDGMQECHSQAKDAVGFASYCFQGEAWTPAMANLADVVTMQLPDSDKQFYPCHFHTRTGALVSWSLLADYAKNKATMGENNRKEIHLYAVPFGRLYQFAASTVGEVIGPLDHVVGADPEKPMYLETLSVKPPIFDVINFFSPEYAADLRMDVKRERKKERQLKPTTVGGRFDAGIKVDGRVAELLKLYVSLLYF